MYFLWIEVKKIKYEKCDMFSVLGEIAKTEVHAFNSVPLETEDIFADLLR